MRFSEVLSDKKKIKLDQIQIPKLTLFNLNLFRKSALCHLARASARCESQTDCFNLIWTNCLPFFAFVELPLHWKTSKDGQFNCKSCSNCANGKKLKMCNAFWKDMRNIWGLRRDGRRETCFCLERPFASEETRKCSKIGHIMTNKKRIRRRNRSEMSSASSEENATAGKRPTSAETKAGPKREMRGNN